LATTTSFEVLRYLPRGVFRVGMAQSHDPGVYRSLRFYAPHVDAMAAVSRTIQETLSGLAEFAGVPVHYLPYGVPMPEGGLASGGGSGVTRTAGPEPGAPLRILYFGRLEREQKRVQLFPEILAGLTQAGIPFHWTVAGAGEEQAWLAKVMQTSAPGQTVSLPGKILYGAVPELLAGHDIFLLASDYEGLPLSLLEAMASGLVPVVSDLPSGIREVVDATTGKLVTPANTPGYAEAIVWLHHHRDELRRLSANAREKVRSEFSVQAMAERWLGVVPPGAPTAPAPWPDRWRIQPILEAGSAWRFSPLMRVLRRWVRGLRAPRHESHELSRTRRL
jgi:glycosyltransferase involved in cell wall biosynthesis